MKKKTGPKPVTKLWMPKGEVRLNPDRTIDEVVIKQPEMVHIEQMNDGLWWIGITVDDVLMHVNFHTKNNMPITVNVQTDDGVISEGFDKPRKTK